MAGDRSHVGLCMIIDGYERIINYSGSWSMRKPGHNISSQRANLYNGHIMSCGLVSVLVYVIITHHDICLCSINHPWTWLTICSVSYMLHAAHGGSYCANGSLLFILYWTSLLKNKINIYANKQILLWAAIWYLPNKYSMYFQTTPSESESNHKFMYNFY